MVYRTSRPWLPTNTTYSDIAAVERRQSAVGYGPTRGKGSVLLLRSGTWSAPCHFLNTSISNGVDGFFCLADPTHFHSQSIVAANDPSAATWRSFQWTATTFLFICLVSRLYIAKSSKINAAGSHLFQSKEIITNQTIWRTFVLQRHRL